MSVERPIVLVAPARGRDAGAGGGAAQSAGRRCCCRTRRCIDLLLPTLDRPLVMTSGNLVGRADRLSQRRGPGAAGAASPTSSSCTTATSRRAATTRSRGSSPGAPVVLRRARGYVPRADRASRRRSTRRCSRAARSSRTPSASAAGREAVLGPHIGDLDNLETYRVYEAVDRAHGAVPRRDARIVAHDLHPDYLSTRYALARPGAVARSACSITTPTSPARWRSTVCAARCSGVAYDGTGYGTDGTAWGGELLLAGYAAFTRLATFRPLPLPGGDAAIRQPWRIALALVDDAFDGGGAARRVPVFRSRVAAEPSTSSGG